MSAEAEVHYFCKPAAVELVGVPVEFLPVQEFLADELSCKRLWDLLSTQFRTRSKFLAIWPGVRYVAMHRNAENVADGFLLVTTPVNWQIDYVVVDGASRGQGIAGSLVRATVHHAYMHKAPYVMLTSRESLRPLYESCGFAAVSSAWSVS